MLHPQLTACDLPRRIVRTLVLPVLAAAALLPAGVAQTQSGTEDDEIHQLPAFNVDTSRDVGYQATNTASISKLNRPLKDVPQSISILNSEFLRDVGADDFAQAMQYSTNVNYKISNADKDFIIRGLSSRSFFVDFLTRETPTDSYMTERIEVVHGPAGVIYGQQDAGGVINVITKRAHLGQNKTSVDLTVGDYNAKRATFDTNVAMGEHQALRVTGLYNKADDYRAFANLNRQGLYADYTWKINPTTSIRFSGENGFDHRTPTNGIVTLQSTSSPLSVAADTTLLPQKYAQSSQGPDANNNLDYFFYTAALTKSLFDDRLNIELTMSESMRDRRRRWSAQVKALSLATKDVPASYLNGYQTTPGYTKGTPVAKQQWQEWVLKEHFRFYRLQAAWKMPEILHGKHVLTFGGTYEPDDFPTDSRQAFLYLNPEGSARGKPYGTTPEQMIPYTSLAGEGMRFPFPLIGNGLYERPNQGFILSKVVKAGFAMLASDWGAEGRFKTLIGVRYDDMFNSNTPLGPLGNTNELQTKSTDTNHIWEWSETIGAIYEITPTINLTANYGTSLYPNVNRFDQNLQLFGPTKGKSYEFGLKALSFDGRLSASFTYFDMDEENSALSIPAAILVQQFGSSTPGRSVAGTLNSKGYEFEMVANPTPSWAVRAGLGYADPKITTDLPQLGYPAGKNLPGVTKYTGTFFSRYTFTHGPLKGLFVGGGFNYRSENYAGYVDTNNDSIGDRQETFPGYTTFDFLAGYSFKAGNKARITLRANVRNAFNKSYIVASDINFAGYGDARQFSLTAGVEF